jgi:hypothetical protein
MIAIDVAGPFSWIDQGNRYLLIAIDYFSKLPETYAISNLEASTVAYGLVTNFCRFTVLRKLHNFESRLIPEVLQRLGVSKTRTTPLHPQSDGMVELYIKTVEEHLRKAVVSHQSDWEARSLIFFLAYSASTHDTADFTPASLVFGRELRLPCDLLFAVHHDKERPTLGHEANLIGHEECRLL